MSSAVRSGVSKGGARPRPRVARASRGRGVAADYLRLVRAFPLRPLRGDKDYGAAAAMLDRLVGRPDLTSGQKDYLAALTTFVEAYDREHHPLDDAPPPLETLKALMEHAGMNTTALGQVLGSKGVASEILNGRRAMSKSHMLKLARRFNVDPGLFLERAGRK